MIVLVRSRLIRLLLAVFATAALAIGGLVAVSGTSHAAVSLPCDIYGWVQQSNGSLLNPQSGLCLDDPSDNTANGTQLQIWTCNGSAVQQFSLG
jgi:hypothetical protein